MRILLCAGLFVAISSPLAFAADYDQPTPVAFDWTGFYAGVNAGAAINDSNVDSSARSGDLPTGIAHELKGTIQSDETVFTGGVQAGYNWQFSNVVMGLAADFNYTDFDQSSNHNRDIAGLGTVDTDLGFKADWFGTVRGRLGFAVERLLVYGTGGLAYGHEKVSGRINADSNSWTASESAVNWGWTLGGGAEFAIDDNWTIGAEYLYVDLGSTDFDFKNNALNDVHENINGDVDAAFSVVRATMQFRF